MKFKFDKTTEAVISFLEKQDECSYDFTLGFPREMVDLGISEEKFYSSCRYLKRKELCDDAFDQNGRVCGIALGHRLMHREEFFWIDLKEFLFHSVAIPIIVSALTSAVIGIGALAWARIHEPKNTIQNTRQLIDETNSDTMIANTIRPTP